jgi:recombination protein RecT
MNEIQHFTQRLKAEINISDYHDAYTIDTAMQAVAIIFSENGGFQKCTPESKYKAVLSMVCQGLNPLKGQCSFVPYGNQLQLLRDYSGSIMVAKREDKRIAAINSKVVREGDEFDMDIVNGSYRFPRHKPTVKSLNGAIIAAYAVAVGHDGQIIDADIMSYEDIKKTWKNAQLKYKGEPVVRQDGSLHPGSNHAKYPEKMTTKTVVHRLCRSIIKSSGNEQISEVADLDDEYVEAELGPEPEIKTLDFAPVPDSEPAPEPPANREQAERILDLGKQQGMTTADVFDGLSVFVGRPVKKIREITQLEAQKYILRLETNHNPEPEDGDEPPWK